MFFVRVYNTIKHNFISSSSQTEPRNDKQLIRSKNTRYRGGQYARNSSRYCTNEITRTRPNEYEMLTRYSCECVRSYNVNCDWRRVRVQHLIRPNEVIVRLCAWTVRGYRFVRFNNFIRRPGFSSLKGSSEYSFIKTLPGDVGTAYDGYYLWF